MKFAEHVQSCPTSQHTKFEAAGSSGRVKGHSAASTCPLMVRRKDLCGALLNGLTWRAAFDICGRGNEDLQDATRPVWVRPPEKKFFPQGSTDLGFRVLYAGPLRVTHSQFHTDWTFCVAMGTHQKWSMASDQSPAFQKVQVRSAPKGRLSARLDLTYHISKFQIRAHLIQKVAPK